MGKALILTDCNFASKNLGTVHFQSGELMSILITGDSQCVIGGANSYGITYQPSTIPDAQKGVTWSVTDMDGELIEDVEIDEFGHLHVGESVTPQAVLVHAVSDYNSDITDTKEVSLIAELQNNTITPSATANSVSVTLSHSAVSTLLISFTDGGTTKTITISSGASGGYVDVTPGASRSVTLSVSPTSDSTFNYVLSPNYVNIPAQQVLEDYDYMLVEGDDNVTLYPISVFPSISISVDDSTGFYAKYKVAQTAVDLPMIGSRLNSLNTRFFVGVGYPNSSTAYMGFATTKTFSGAYSTSGTMFEAYNNYQNSRKLVLNDSEINISDTLISHNTNFGLLASLRQDGTKGYFPKHLEVYNVVITQGQNIIHDIVASKRTTDNRIGFRDKITNTFIPIDLSIASIVSIHNINE